MTNADANDGLRVVLDSNVLISAFAFPRGVPHELLQLLVRGEFDAAVSPLILREVEDVLRNKLRVPEATIRRAISFIKERCQLIDTADIVSVPSLSNADNRVLSCGLAFHAHYLVTGDKEMQNLVEFQGVRIVSSAAFLRERALG